MWHPQEIEHAECGATTFVMIADPEDAPATAPCAGCGAALPLPPPSPGSPSVIVEGEA